MDRVWIVVVSTVLMVMPTLAQSGRCPQIVARALELVSEACADVGRNQACYGHIDLTAIPQPTVTDFRFERIGDIARVTDLANLTLRPMDEQAGTWGVALMRLQVNLPDALPGQNVTFILFGDASLSPNPVEGFAPMQAFFLRTGIGDAPCAEAPASGLIVQTPQGAGEVTFNVNGVNVSMGSTILFRSMTGEEMNISALEGAAVVEFDGALYPVVAGTWTRMALGQDGLLARPALPTAYLNEALEALPLNLLERPIIPRLPMTAEELEKLYDFLRRGEVPCGDEMGVFPPCDLLPRFDDIREGAIRWALGSDWAEALPFRVNYEGRLLDVLQEGESLIMIDDDGSVCVLETTSRTESRPSCNDVFELDWLDSAVSLISAQQSFSDFFDTLNNIDNLVPAPAVPSVPQAPQVVPPVVVPVPAVPLPVLDPQPPHGDDRGGHSDDDNDDGDDDDDDDD